MYETPRQTLRRATQNLIGNAADNLHRAKAAWSGLSPEEMAKPYGASRQTKAVVLQGYQEAYDQALDAQEYLEKLITKE